MGTFELDRDRQGERRGEPFQEEVLAAERAANNIDSRRIRQECIIALKVYDHCRQPHCKIQQQGNKTPEAASFPASGI